MSETLQVRRVGDHVLCVTINRPEKRNAINSEVAAGIDRAVKEAEGDHLIRAVVLTSTGEQSFCAGADLGEVAAGRHAGLVTPDGGFAGLTEAKRSKPWIAAVDAPALGGGMELCLACDMVVASERAVFGLPEAKRGVIASAGGIARIARRIAPSVANELLATGHPIDARRAYDLGFVNRVTPPGDALAGALALASRIAENAPVSVQQSLLVARAAFDHDEAGLFALMRAAGAVVRVSEDAKEGVQAFLEKRTPQWLGR